MQIGTYILGLNESPSYRSHQQPEIIGGKLYFFLADSHPVPLKTGQHCKMYVKSGPSATTSKAISNS